MTKRQHRFLADVGCAHTQAMLRRLKANPSESIGSFRTEVADLRKFAVLNYIAVIKCVHTSVKTQYAALSRPWLHIVIYHNLHSLAAVAAHSVDMQCSSCRTEDTALQACTFAPGRQVGQEAESAPGYRVRAPGGGASAGCGAPQPAVLLHLPQAGGARH
jgi:hypothetical protein